MRYHDAFGKRRFSLPCYVAGGVMGIRRKTMCAESLSVAA